MPKAKRATVLRSWRSEAAPVIHGAALKVLLGPRLHQWGKRHIGVRKKEDDANAKTSEKCFATPCLEEELGNLALPGRSLKRVVKV